MLAMGGDEEKKAPAMSAEQKRLNPMAAAGGSAAGKLLAGNVAKTAIQNSIKRSVTKQDLSKEFRQKSFIDSREKIITLSKKSGLRKINALNVARDLRKKLREKAEFTFEDFKETVMHRIEKKVKSAISMQIYEVTLREIFNLFDADRSNTVDA